MNILVIFNTRCMILVITNVRVVISYMHNRIEENDTEWDRNFIWDLLDSIVEGVMNILLRSK